MMARFASGKDAYGISDRSGFRYRLRDMRKEWNGFLVGKDEWEAKHPQLEITRHPPDAEALRDPRPDSRVAPEVEHLLGLNAFLTGASGSNVITVTEPSHGRTTGDVVRFRSVKPFDGFLASDIEYASGNSITVVSVDRYTFVANSGTATEGGQRGGGGSATSGPVTLVV
jgi:hypothetical protein